MVTMVTETRHIVVLQYIFFLVQCSFLLRSAETRLRKNSLSLTKGFNPLKTKRRPLYLKTQSVPRCKHFSFRL